MGTGTICLDPMDHGPLVGLMPALSSPASAGYPRALFSVHLSELMSDDQRSDFDKWRNFLGNMALVGMYTSLNGSSCFLLLCPWNMWTRLAGMRGYKLIFETDGTDSFAGSHGLGRKRRREEDSATPRLVLPE
ncbi:uncharacterized protein DSM5745_09754 [Aspergillus mulundensis]|uniref:Uncharacterized protein n=1 Tax=Aspergillus mulundensis TaxID=1810919 RepID=A0A3D8QRA1_9EURO|nr:hypothetical protein DSM5745_09754 [Aspergillus mulundensis]RDW64343.1 hypothetical protein DSM5745_09754 [Aspergillus mulundensis]